MQYPHAVEVKPSQAKKLGFSSNAYIVEGSSVLHIFGGAKQPQPTATLFPCEVSTRAKSTVMWLEATTTPIGLCEPRPTRADGWTKENGLWKHS